MDPLVRLLCLLPLAVAGAGAGAGSGAGGGVRVGAETALGASVLDLQWLGKDKSTVLLQTQQGFLLRSTDGGETWMDIRNQFNRSTQALLPGLSPYARIRRIFRSPVDPYIVFAQGAFDDNFVSSDAGQSWTRIALHAKLHGFIFHSNRPHWALLSSWTQTCLEPNGKPCSHSLFLTKDLGKTFELVNTHIVQFSWGKAEFKQEDRIYFTHFREKTGSQQKLTRWMSGIDFVYTDDFGKNVVRVLKEGNKFQVSYNYILVVKVIDTARQNVSLMISSTGAETFEAAKLPHRLWQHSFALLDASEGALVLHVNQGVDAGDIYISDKNGEKFTLSLTHNVRQGGFCAFEKVMNLNGIYISNVFESYEGKQQVTKEDKPKDVEASPTGTLLEEMRPLRYRRLDGPESEHVGLQAGDEGPALGSEAERRAASRGLRARVPLVGKPGRRLADQPSRVRSVISFDAGGAWSYLAAPQVDSLGSKIECVLQNNCSLHLHDFTEVPAFAPVYSYRNAVGIIMGSGNVGPYLSRRHEDTNTYLSRDGGRTWIEVHKGTYIYEFGNHGGLLVMADMKRPTKEALYSWDEGNSWTTFNVSAGPIRVDNVIIEPDATSTKFLLYGERDRKGLAMMLDFGSLHQRTCQGVASAGTSSSDYEKWTVPCILGEQRVYSRRKQLSQCFNNETTESYKTKQHCKCTPANYECELGFTRSIGGMDCYLDNSRVLPKAASAGCPGIGQYKVDAYRRVPGDVCKGGWKPRRKTLPCPGANLQQTAVGTLNTTEGSSLPVKLLFLLGTLGLGACLSRSGRCQGWVKVLRERIQDRRTLPDVGGAPKGTQVGISTHEMTGLAGAMDQQQSGYRPPEM